MGIENMDIVIDVSIAEETSTTYQTSLNEITEMMTNLQSSIEALRGNWQGEASQSFTLDHFPKLYKNMQEHVDMIKVLQQEIAAGIQDFNALDVELKGKF